MKKKNLSSQKSPLSRNKKGTQMKYFKLIFIFTLIALFYTNIINATNYYICDCALGADPNCVVGDDANSGTSLNSPWRSTIKVNSVINSLQAGDQILFSKGGAWTDASIGNISNFNATASSPIVFDSYIPSWGGTAKPILTESRVDTNAFNFVDGGNADHDEGYIVRNLNLRGADIGQWGVFAYNDVDYIQMENLGISGFEIGVHCAGANTTNSGADDQNQHMKLLNSTITNCSGQGFLGGADYLLIEDCLFQNNGFAQAIFNHNIYVSNGDHVIIRNNELYQSAVIDGKADGVSLVVHGMLDDLLIEGNYVHEDLGMVTGNAWGIAVDPGYASAEGFTNLIIRGNLLVNMFNKCIGVASAPGAIIENNVIINEAAASIIAIAAPDRIRGDNDMEMTNVIVRNNSVYLRNANTSTIGVLVGEEGNGHEIISNIISVDNGNGFSLNLVDIDYATVNYNMMELVNNANWGAGQGLNSWSLLRGFDQNSFEGNPQFTSPGLPNYNLIPLSSSLVIEAGHPTLSSPIDYTGAPRNGVADMGAYENFILSISDNQTGLNRNIINCFPNPTNGQIIFKSDISMVGTTYTVYNYNGQRVLKGKIVSEQMALELGGFSSGNYLIVFGENMNQIIKVIKK
jgi:hypothetical protein